MFTEDWEKVLLFLYAQEGILPKEKQIEVLAHLCSWDSSRSRQAFEEAEKRGMSATGVPEIQNN